MSDSVTLVVSARVYVYHPPPQKKVSNWHVSDSEPTVGREFRLKVEAPYDLQDRTFCSCKPTRTAAAACMACCQFHHNPES